jgi:hypothetical protein
MSRRNFILGDSAAIDQPLPIRQRDNTIKLWDATSGALNRSAQARSGARLVSGVLARRHPDMSFGTDNTPRGLSYALDMCGSSKCARFGRNLTRADRRKAKP